jgi:pyridoxine 5-phosphate synthase
LGFAACEIHTGPYAHLYKETGANFSAGTPLLAEYEKIAAAGRQIIAAGMRFNAGHALNYLNVRPIAALPNVRELHIGHAIVSRAVFVGLREAVREMKRLMDKEQQCSAAR